MKGPPHSGHRSQPSSRVSETSWPTSAAIVSRATGRSSTRPASSESTWQTSRLYPRGWKPRTQKVCSPPFEECEIRTGSRNALPAHGVAFLAPPESSTDSGSVRRKGLSSKRGGPPFHAAECFCRERTFHGQPQMTRSGQAEPTATDHARMACNLLSPTGSKIGSGADAVETPGIKSRRGSRRRQRRKLRVGAGTRVSTEGQGFEPWRRLHA